MLGTTQIFGGPGPQPRDIVDLIESERVTVVGAVPTVWSTIRDLCLADGRDISSIRLGLCGGSAPARSLMEDFDNRLDAPMLHAWGMTETTPIGTISRLKSYMQDWTDEEQYAVRSKQGYVAAGVQLRLVDAVYHYSLIDYSYQISIGRPAPPDQSFLHRGQRDLKARSSTNALEIAPIVAIRFHHSE
jgi:acyl-CoA synthetase (AMP-forming)/AMP-acid ligase II